MRTGKRYSKLVVVLLILVAAGCSRHVPHEIDISKGIYYEEEEYQKLSKKRRETYCAELARELDRLQVRSSEAQARLERNRDNIQQFTRELRDAERDYSRMSLQVEELTRQIRELESLPKEWELQFGECLWIVAGYEQIYGDPLKWPRLWRANWEMIEDPDWVLAGWKIQVPRSWPTRHTVRRDEWLARIAGYWEIYDNYRKWPTLFEANKDRIKDPDLIFPHQELVVPREYPVLD